MKRTKSTFIALVTVLLSPMAANADLITSSSGGTVVDFSQFPNFVALSATPTEIGGLVGESIGLSSNASSPGISYASYGLGDNGRWDNATRQGYAALDNTFQSGFFLEFFFNAGAVSSVGGFINYAICSGPQCSPSQPAIIEALGAGGVVLESYDLTAMAPISTPGQQNAGAFRGIMRGSNDIFAFRLYNAVNVIDDFEFARAVPEPGTLALLGIGLLGMAATRRRKKV